MEVKQFALFGQPVTRGNVEFPAPVARLTDPETSRAAARDAERVSGVGRKLALKSLYEHSAGLTDFELASITGWQQTSIGKRRNELVKMKLVEMAYREVDGKRFTIKRPAPSGSASIVWRITSQGVDYVKENYNA